MKARKAKMNRTSAALRRMASSSVGGKPQVVLLAVTGMTPAVLTETVWALARQDPPVIPDRVVVVTTKAQEWRRQVGFEARLS